MTRRTWAWYVAIGALAVIVHVLLAPGLGRDLFGVAVSSTAVAAIGLGLRAYPSVPRVPWVLLAVGNGMWVVGDLIWAILAARGLDPFPSVADVIYLLAYVVLGLGLYRLARARRPEVDAKADRRRYFMLAHGCHLLDTARWLGGEIVYRYRVGVNRTRDPEGPDNWTPVLNENELSVDEPRRVEVEGSPVLLYRHEDEICAIGAVCGHAAGALEHGSFEGGHVTCPLHQSVYNLCDGSVVHGPSLYAEPAYEVRVHEGKIEVKLRRREEAL